MSNVVTSLDFPVAASQASSKATGWRAERLLIAGMIVVTAGLIAVKPGLVHYEFPAASMITGVFLYRRNPVLYVTFTIWLYFLTPLIRRIVDFSSSWMNPNPILLAPLLTTCITAIFLLTDLNRSWFRKSMWPYGFVFLGIMAGLLGGLLFNPDKKDVLAACLNWVSPICIGYYVARYPLNRNDLKKTITQAFVVGALVMGTYGIYQFVQAPAWDCNWLDQMTSGDISVSVMGRPEPFGLRVWGTMNSPGPFSTALTVALLLLFVETRKIRIPAALAGFVSLLLSLVRSGWLGCTAGLLAVFVSNKRYISRALFGLGLGIVLLLPALPYEPFAEAVSARFQSFQSMSGDESVNERAAGYANLSEDIVKNPLGLGLTNKDRLNGYVLDSTLLRLPLQLGWAGCLLYLAGIGSLVRQMFPLTNEFQFGVIARAIVLSVLVRAPFGQVLVNFDGLILWMFCGLAVAEAQARTVDPLSLPYKLNQSHSSHDASTCA